MEPSRGDSRYNLNYSMSNIGLTLADPADIYGNPSALSGRPPSVGMLQGLGGGGGSSSVGLLPRSAGNLISNTQCQSIGNNQQRAMKRAGSDCYEDSHHRVGGGGITNLTGLDNCGGSTNVQHSGQQQPQTSGGGVQDIVDESFNNMQSKKSPPANGKKTKGRVKIKMEYIDNKLRRYTTFSKRKTGIMKKAYELSTLTGTQVMLLVASETGHVYTFATRKLQPMITSEAGKQLIQTCLNSPDPPSLGSGDQRMSATGFEETELSYNIADEDSKDRSQCSSGNDSEESSDNEIGIVDTNNCSKSANFLSENPINIERSNKMNYNDKIEISNGFKTGLPTKIQTEEKEKNSKSSSSSLETIHYTSENLPKNVLMQLIEGGHLEVHNEEDGSGHQYVAIPLPSSSANSSRQSQLATENEVFKRHSSPRTHLILQKDIHPEFNIKDEP